MERGLIGEASLLGFHGRASVELPVDERCDVERLGRARPWTRRYSSSGSLVASTLPA